MNRSVSTSRFIALAAILGLLVFALSGSLFAQTETGTITGTVTDPTGALVTNAKITVTNVATGGVRTGQTNERGEYALTNLLPGTYTVLVEAPNFAKSQTQVVVTVGSKIGSDFRLVVGNAASTTVEVVASGSASVNIETQTLSETIDNQKIEELPQFNRNPYALVGIAGTVSEDDPSGRGAMGFSINGLRAAGTNVLLDGAANNDEFTGSVGQQVPVDSMQEFSVITSNFTAEYGRASAGIVNVATKSGSNALHGSAYEFNRISAFSSNSVDNNVNGTPKGLFARNLFGYSVGGPVIKNKLFFFNNTEWTRVRSGGTENLLIPTSQFIGLTNTNTQGFFTALGGTRPNLAVVTPGFITRGAPGDPCTGATCSAAVPVGTPLFDEVSYKVPIDTGGGAPQNTYDVVGRVDLNISDRTQFYTRYALYNEIDQSGFIDNSPYAGYDTGQNIRDQNMLVSLTHSLSSRVVSQSKFVYNRLNLLQPLGSHAVGPTMYAFGTQGMFLNGVQVAFPGYSFNTPGNAIPFGGPQNFFQAYQDMSVQRGAHQFRFGGNYEFLQDNRAFGAYEEAVEQLSKTSNKGHAMDNFVAGQLDIFQAAIYPQGSFPCPYGRPFFNSIPAGQPCGTDLNGDGIVGNDPGEVTDPNGTVTLPVGPPNFTRSNHYHEFGTYAQDSWKVKPHFTLNLGLRWEYFGVQHNSNPRLDSNYYDGSGGNIFDQIRNGDVALAPQSPVHGLWAKDWSDFSPRLGFAWDVFGNGKTSLRGGWGIGYERNFGNVTFNVIQNPPNYGVISLQAGVDVPSLVVDPANFGPLGGASGVKALPKVSLRNVNPHIKTAYAHDFSLSLEHEISRNLVASAQYSGSKGERLYSIEAANLAGAGNVYLGDDPNSIVANTGAPLGLTRLRPTQYSGINRRGGNGFSNYNALNLKLESRSVGSTGLSATINYTYAHALDNLSSTFSESFGDDNLGLLDPFNPKLDYGSAEFDNRQRIAVSAIWEVPFGRHSNGLTRMIAGGWTITPIFTARTGSPFTIYDCDNANQNCPRLMFNGSLPTHGSQGTFLGPNDYSYIDLSSNAGVDDTYVNPIVGISDFGPFPTNMVKRNTFRSPGIWNGVDLGVYKDFKFTEKFNLQLRAEAFNVLNHSNLYVQVYDNFSPFQVVDAKRGASAGNVALNNPGGYEHRNLQLGAKFTF